MPRLSVIMGVYNVENQKMAELSINSILNQTYQDFELIICEDGSDQFTLLTINKVCGSNKKVKIIRNKINKGLAYSLNRCIEISTGEFIARMDIDDISYLDRFEKQINFLNAHSEYSLVSSWADLFDEKNVWGIRKLKPKPQKKDFLFGSPILHAGMIIRRNDLLEAGCYRVAWETKRAEDYDLFMRLYALGYKAYTLQEPLYQIREDKNAYKRRSYVHRLEECIVRYKGFSKLHLYPKGCLFVIKPLIVGLLPQRLLSKIRNERIW